jgi:hypothetical protein
MKRRTDLKQESVSSTFAGRLTSGEVCLSAATASLRMQAPNPSIERTSYSWLRQLQAASHVKR